VVGNLLNNASKYTPPGGTITLAARGDGACVRVEVTDDGIGIAAADLCNVFDLFVQVGDAREHAQGGLGIGLTLVKRLVEMHGGVVTAHSEGRGRGARFTIELPCVAADAGVASAPQDARAPGAARRVVIVDDNHDAADMLALTLQMLGHEARAVYDPLLAVDVIAAFAPQVAFVDLGMPRLGGVELAGMIRERFGASIRLVALTGWGQPADRERTRQAGFDFHFVKPIDLAQVQKLCSDE
jgi:CheY-like chemotaxis protein